MCSQVRRTWPLEGARTGCNGRSDARESEGDGIKGGRIGEVIREEVGDKAQLEELMKPTAATSQTRCLRMAYELRRASSKIHMNQGPGSKKTIAEGRLVAAAGNAVCIHSFDATMK